MLGEPLRIYVAPTMEYILGSLFAMTLGTAFLVYRGTNERQVMHHKGKPVMLRIGKMNMPVDEALMIFFGVVGICAGFSSLMTGLGR